MNPGFVPYQQLDGKVIWLPRQSWNLGTPGKPQPSKSQGQAENWPAGGSWSSQVSIAQRSESRRMMGVVGAGGVVGRGREGRRKKELEMPWPNGPWDRSGQSHVDPVLPMGCRA